MNYIIDPMWFYWISVIDSVVMVFVALFVVSLVSTLVLFAIKIFDDPGTLNKPFIISVIVLSVSTLAITFIPSKDVLIGMKVAELATYDNADITVDTIKSIVDYILQAIKGA